MQLGAVWQQRQEKRMEGLGCLGFEWWWCCDRPRGAVDFLLVCLVG